MQTENYIKKFLHRKSTALNLFQDAVFNILHKHYLYLEIFNTFLT